MTKASPRDGFGQALLELGISNAKILALSADLKESTRCQAFAERFPERFIDLGVAEQNMMGVAAGLATEGFIPFCASFAVFNPGRNWEQLRVSVCYNNVNVKIIGAHAGLATGPDGATHQALEDLAITRVLPNLVVLAPADLHETKAATLAAAKHQGPVYIRFSRAEELIVTKPNEQFTIGRAKVWQTGRDVTLCTTGSMLQPALQAAELVKQKEIQVELLHFPTVKPLDVEQLVDSARKTKIVVVVEEAQRSGGLGGAISETLSEKLPVPVIRLGVNDTFGESGSAVGLRQKYHLAVSDIKATLIQSQIKK